MEEEMNNMQQVAGAGRSTDTVMAHMTLGEVVLPRDMVEDPEVRQLLDQIFQAYGASINEFTVGDPSNKINPETGYPEFFFKKLFKKILPIAAPILGTMIPGVGPVLGGALGGAVGGAASGKGLGGILSGALMGGVGGHLTGGAGGILGKTAGATLAETTGNAALQGPTMGTGLRGALSGGGLSALTSGAGGQSLSNLAKIGGSLYSAQQEDEAQKKARNAMLAANAPYSEMGLEAQRKLSTNLAQGFNPGDLASDAGYQFRLKQGQDALNASLAAQGLGQSGAALKAAQEYGQGFAQNEYSNAYDRWLQQNSQLAGLGSQGFTAGNAVGDVNAAYNLQRAEAKNKRIAEILSGLGYGS